VSHFSKKYSDTVQKLRVPLGFALLATFAWLSTPTLRSVMWGIPIAGVGLWLRAWAAGYLEKNQRLITGGPYAWVRNPLYVGSLIAVMGLAVGAKRPLLAWVFFLFFYFVYLPVVQLEEQHLRKLFPEFEEYARKVRMFWPGIPEGEAEGEFRWELYQRNEEYKALIAFLIAIAFLWWKATLAMAI